jgi:hypothetical protein
VTAGLYLVFAGWLLLGAKRWADILAKLQYDPQREARQWEGDAEDGSPSADKSGTDTLPATRDPENQ